MTSLDQRILNLRPDPIDPRDHDYAARRFARVPVELPESVDHSGLVGPVVDQGNTGSCVGQACASLCHWLFGESFSARYVWMTAKEIDPWIPSVFYESAGTRIRDAMKALNKYGACTDYYWPFSELLPDTEVEEATQADAMAHRIGEYWKLSSVAERKRHLALVGPYVAGVPVYENWDSIEENGVVPAPAGAELGGHAILIVGYDSDSFLFKNSWGEDWGFLGYGHLAPDYPTWDCWGTGAPVR